MNIGKNIRNLRQQRGWSQEDISKLLDISVPAFSKIETGLTDINLSRLEQIAAVFGMSATQLISLNSESFREDHAKLDLMNEHLITREAEVIELQHKVIQLYEELRSAETERNTHARSSNS